MGQIRYKFAWLLMLLLFPMAASAQTGKIRGVVADKNTGETIIGANVVISGTTRGSATNIDGEYIIIGLSPGKYNLEVSYLGYKKIVINDVLVRIDLTTTQNFDLEEETFQGEEITVVAQKELIQKDVTASLSSVGREQIQAIPVENLAEVVGLQAGVVDGHFRGGRAGEVGYWVDGIPVTDVFNGGVAQNVENASVQEVQVVTGAFAAEYGQAMSGIVNIVTRDGSNEFSGGFKTFEGDYLSSRKDIFMNIDDINPIAVKNIEGNIEGPIIKDKLFFFASARYFENEGWLYGQQIFSQNDVGFTADGRLALLDTLGTGDKSIVSMNPYERLSGQFKLTWRVTTNIKLSANMIVGAENFRNYSHDSRFLPDFQNEQFTKSRSNYLKMTHTLSNRTFYDISVSNNFNDYETYAFEDINDSRYLPNSYTAYRALNATSNFLVGGSNNGRYYRSTDTWLSKFDITSQVNNQNQVKLGVEARMHTLTTNDETVIVNELGGDNLIQQNGDYKYKPLEVSAYLQDKVEIGSLIINAGVRFDYFDANGKVFSDPNDPDIIFEAQRANYQGNPFKDSDPIWQFSPRLGIAFPISAGGVIHFSYGHFFQIPNFEILYRNPYFRLNSGGALIGLVGNANLKPQKTINGEIGLKQELSSSSAVEVTAFFRDIRDLAGTANATVPVTGTSVRYGKIQNSDFGFIKGLVLSYDQFVGGGFSFNVNYTFQVAKGNSSDPAQAYSAAAAKQLLETQILPLDWDQLHTINLTTTYTAKSWGFGTVMTYGSGFPYTPSLSTQQTGAIVPSTIPYNSERKPSTFRMDMNLYKNFNFGKQSFQIFALIDNLLDTGNELGIFGDTGRATYSLQKLIDEKSFAGDPYYLNQWYNRPDFYNEPRRVTLGIKYNF